MSDSYLGVQSILLLSILIWVCKVFCLFQQTFAGENFKGNIMKRQKTSALKHFSLPRYSKKWTT